ncbi:MAG: succinate dehydrogenase iron-sulfur subunit [bacterium]
MEKTFRILRYNPEKDTEGHFQDYKVPYEKGLTVLEGLYYILENLDATLAFRSSCRAAICGSCAMHINGQYRLACRTQVSALNADLITIRPLAHMTILKDLVVDLKPFFDNYKKIEPYLQPEAVLPDKEFKQSEKQRAKIDKLVDCILCSACYGSCPVVSMNEKYLGPHALVAALRFINDSRDSKTSERLAIVANDEGIFRCHTIFNCQQVCPKDIDPTNAILKLRLKSFTSKLVGKI